MAVTGVAYGMRAAAYSRYHGKKEAVENQNEDVSGNVEKKNSQCSVGSDDDMKRTDNGTEFLSYIKWFKNAADYTEEEKETTKGVTLASGTRAPQITTGNKGKVPYSELAEDGIVSYNGVNFQCDYERNALCLGDTSDSNQCLTIPLSAGGSLIVNRNNIGDLGSALGMFSPEDVNRILRAITQDQQVQDKINELEEDENNIEDKSMLQQLQEQIQEMHNKLANGDVEQTFQIGGQTYSLKEWDEMLQKFDELQEAIAEQSKAEQEKKMETKREEALRNSDTMDALTSNSTKSTDADNQGDQKTWYITCYTEQGIWTKKCIEGGESEDLWRVNYQSPEQYQKVLEFINRFEKDANLTFARDENFWKDFLSGKMDDETFSKTYPEFKFKN